MCGRKPCDSNACTWGEQYRAICEARTIMKWTKPRRIEYYAMVERSRGAVAAQKLIADINHLWKESYDRRRT